ncbi:hypothetical protein Q5E55_017640 [Acinetobacter baumannii]
MMDHSKGSLWDNPVLLDLKGNIIKNGNKEILKNSKKEKQFQLMQFMGMSDG